MIGPGFFDRPKMGHRGPVRRSTVCDEIPFLAVARSLGDLWSYNPKKDVYVVSPEPDVHVYPIDIDRQRWTIIITRIMVSKGMVSKSKYWISEKNKGMSVSICLNFRGIFQSQYSLFLKL